MCHERIDLIPVQMSPRLAQCVIPIGQKYKNQPLWLSNTDSLPRGQSCPADNKQRET